MVATINPRSWFWRHQWFILACLLVAAIKLWVVSDLEIIAKNKPLDELWYARSARDFYWFAESYDHLTFCRQPGYPLWIALVGITGIPLRVAMELLVIGASLSLSFALMIVGAPMLAVFLIYLLMSFHPYTFQLNCILLQDMLYGPLLWVCLAALIMAYATRSASKSAIWAGVAGLLLGVLWNTRPENPLIVGTLAVACLLFAPVYRSVSGSWRRGVAHVGKTTLIISGGIAAIIMVICSANYRHYGLFVTYDLAAPGYRNAMDALLSIRVKKPIRYVSISSEAMEHAARVSPSFRSIKPRIDAWAQNWYSRHEPPAPGEIVAGQFYWALRRAASRRGYHSSATAANGFYQQMANEIDVACRENVIPCRTTVLPIISSDFWALREYIPESFLRVIRIFVFNGSQLPYAKDDVGSIPPRVRRLFNEVANRRARITRYPKVTIGGNAHHATLLLVAVAVRNQGGKVLASTDQQRETSQPYPQTAVSDTSRLPKAMTFRLSFTPTAPLYSGQLVLITNDGSEHVLPLDHILRQRSGSLTGEAPDDLIHYEITELKNLELEKHTKAQVRDLVYVLYKAAVIGLSLTGFVGLVAFVVLPWVPGRGRLLSVLVLLLFVIISRVVLFTLIDATSWGAADHIRYIYPVIPVYMAVAVSFTFVGVRSVLSAARRHPPRRSDEPDLRRPTGDGAV